MRIPGLLPRTVPAGAEPGRATRPGFAPFRRRRPACDPATGSSPANPTLPSSTSAPVPAGGPRLKVPSLGLDLALGPLMEITADSGARWPRNVCADPDRAASTGTLHLVLHAAPHGDGPGNPLVDAGSGRSRLSGGDRVALAGNDYVVGSVNILGESQLMSAGWLWDDLPGRLLIMVPLAGFGRPRIVVVAAYLVSPSARASGQASYARNVDAPDS